MNTDTTPRRPVEPECRSRRSTIPRIRFTLLGAAIFAFGLLIWSRLLLVTNYPKTAIAEPAAKQRAAALNPD